MTKIISLSDRAYEILKNLKQEKESFTDVVLRIADEKKSKSIITFAGILKDAKEENKKK